jgi:hypothetical protein
MVSSDPTANHDRPDIGHINHDRDDGGRPTDALFTEADLLTEHFTRNLRETAGVLFDLARPFSSAATTSLPV